MYVNMEDLFLSTCPSWISSGREKNSVRIDANVTIVKSSGAISWWVARNCILLLFCHQIQGKKKSSNAWLSTRKTQNTYLVLFSLGWKADREREKNKIESFFLKRVEKWQQIELWSIDTHGMKETENEGIERTEVLSPLSLSICLISFQTEFRVDNFKEFDGDR